MNVSFLISNLSGGGAENVCTIIANTLSKLNWNVEIIVLTSTKKSNRNNLKKSIKYVSLNSTRARYSSFKLAMYLHFHSPDILVTMNNEVLIAEFFANFLIPRKHVLVHRCVTTLSSTVYQAGNRRFSLFRYWLLKIALKRVDCIVNQCNSMEEDTKREINLYHSINQTIFNPVYLNKFKSNKISSLKISYILLVGRLDSNKCFQLAIEAIAALPHYLQNIELWIAGTGPCKQELLDHARKYEICHRVKLLGFRSDLNHLYQNAALVSLTSKFEGFPNVLLESIANGTPIVAVDCPNGPKEIVIDGVNGFLVKNRNAKALSSAYTKALKWRWHRYKIRQTANRFAEERIVKEWDTLLRCLLELHELKHA